MRCEVCGRGIIGKPRKAVIEGAKMIVCGECAKLGSTYLEVPPKPRLKSRTKPQPKLYVKRPPHTNLEGLELVNDYHVRIRQAREKLGLSHKDLGRKIGEKVSVLRKVESSKMIPNHNLANKLERALKVKLLVSPSKLGSPDRILASPREITLGEIVQLKRKEPESEE